MKIMTFDVASACGWSVWDMDRSEASMVTGCIRTPSFPKGTAGQIVRGGKRRSLFEQIPPLFRLHKPDAVVIEAPLDNVVRFKKTGKRDLLTGAAADNGVEVSGMNPAAAFLPHQLFALVDTFAMAFCKSNVFEVRPQSWQAILKPYKHAGNTKAQSIEACRVLRISLPSQAWAKDNAADAAMIAVWAKGHLQQLKLLQRAKEAEAA